MLKQAPGRNQRPKVFKVKHVLHLCVLLAICIWLLYQVKHSHDKKVAYEDGSLEILQKIQRGPDEIIKFGRRDLRPRVKDTSFDIEKHGEKEEGLDEETEGSRSEESDQEDGRGGGDDEIDGNDQERAEEEESEGVEDLIDEEDRERDEGSDEQEGEEDKGIDFEDVNLLEDHIQEAREEHFKDDDSSASVMQNVQAISGRLRKVQEKEVERENEFEVEKEIKTYFAQDFVPSMKDSDTKGHHNLRAKSSGSDNGKRVQIGNEFASSRADNDASSSTSLVKAEANEQSKVKNDSVLLLVKVPTSLNGASKLGELMYDQNRTSSGRESYLQGHLNLTLSTIVDFNGAQEGMLQLLNGSQSISSQGTWQYNGTEKSTNENADSVGESKTNSGLDSGGKSPKTLTTDVNLDAVEEQGEGKEGEKSSDSSDFALYQEDHSSPMDGL